MSCFTESENCKYELNKSTSSLVDVSLSTPIPLESSAMKKTSVVLPQSSETPSLSLEANHQHQRDIGHTSLNSSSIISDGSSFFLNKINDDSKDNGLHLFKILDLISVGRGKKVHSSIVSIRLKGFVFIVSGVLS